MVPPLVKAWRPTASDRGQYPGDRNGKSYLHADAGEGKHDSLSLKPKKTGERGTMARKKDNYYFDAFVELVDYSCQAANLLHEIVNNFEPEKLEEKIKEMHAIEHAADEARNQMVRKLTREFITPIEREDIIALANAIDDVTDKIEDVVLRMYMYNITSIQEDALQLAGIVVKCCNELKAALVEFPNFRKSQTLHQLIVKVNNLEEEGDKLFTKATRQLYVNGKSYLEVAAWDQTFHYLERCCDACEEVANVIESIVMKNS